MSFEFKTVTFDKTQGIFSQKIDDGLLQQQLNKYGQSGWNLASSTNVGSPVRPRLLIIMQRSR